MSITPHKEKIDAALRNPKCGDGDRDLLGRAVEYYTEWREKTDAINVTGADKVREMTALLNEYKDQLEVELIAKILSLLISIESLFIVLPFTLPGANNEINIIKRHFIYG